MAFPRFLIAGGVNTTLTYCLYLGLLRLMPYAWAYSLAYVVGLGFGYVLNGKWVFQRQLSPRTATVYPLTYALHYGVGMTLLWLLVELVHVPKAIAPLLVVTVSAPFMYALTRAIFQGRPSHETTNNDQRLPDALLAKNE